MAPNLAEKHKKDFMTFVGENF